LVGVAAIFALSAVAIPVAWVAVAVCAVVKAAKAACGWVLLGLGRFLTDAIGGSYARATAALDDWSFGSPRMVIERRDGAWSWSLCEYGEQVAFGGGDGEEECYRAARSAAHELGWRV